MKQSRLVVALACVQLMLVTVFAQPNHSASESKYNLTAHADPCNSASKQNKLAKVAADMKALYEAMNDEENPPDESLRRQYNKMRDEYDRLAGVKKVTAVADVQSSNEAIADAAPLSSDEIEAARKEDQRKREARDSRQKQTVQNNYENEILMAFPDYPDDKVRQIVDMTVAKVKANPTAVPKDPDMLKAWKIYRKYFMHNV